MLIKGKFEEYKVEASSASPPFCVPFVYVKRKRKLFWGMRWNHVWSGENYGMNPHKALPHKLADWFAGAVREYEEYKMAWSNND